MARWSIEDGTPRPARVLCNDRELKRVQVADEERGYAECLVVDPMGKYVPEIIDGRLDIKRHTYRGEVVIEWD